MIGGATCLILNSATCIFTRTSKNLLFCNFLSNSLKRRCCTGAAAVVSSICVSYVEGIMKHVKVALLHYKTALAIKLDNTD